MGRRSDASRRAAEVEGIGEDHDRVTDVEDIVPIGVDDLGVQHVAGRVVTVHSIDVAISPGERAGGLHNDLTVRIEGPFAGQAIALSEVRSHAACRDADQGIRPELMVEVADVDLRLRARRGSRANDERDEQGRQSDREKQSMTGATTVHRETSMRCRSALGPRPRATLGGA